MIKTASLENSKRLYELAPEWNDTEFVWVESNKYGVGESFIRKRIPAITHDIPAPDLDWLLDKLPNKINVPKWPFATLMMICPTSKEYYFGYVTQTGEDFPFDKRAIAHARDDSPCDAACLLLIRLIEQGIVKV